MNDRLRAETEALTRSWMRHDDTMLRDYLVSSVEDPRLNVQSILTRHFLIEGLLGGRFARLKQAELEFASSLNWLQRILGDASDDNEREALRHGLETGADNAEGIGIPTFVRKLYSRLPARVNGLWIPNYLRQVLTAGSRVGARPPTTETILDHFALRWRRRLAFEKVAALSVIEAACGSANDYRFLQAYGLGPLVNYTGFDLCEKNITNAKHLFPNISFKVGNVFEIDASTKSFDYGFAHDLFEHLSPEGLETAIPEFCRVVRKGICIGFFNMEEIDDHIVRPVEEYHWNTLSAERVRELFEQQGGTVQIVHIGTYLRWQVACDETHNPRAYTFFVRFVGKGGAKLI